MWDKSSMISPTSDEEMRDEPNNKNDRNSSDD